MCSYHVALGTHTTGAQKSLLNERANELEGKHQVNHKSTQSLPLAGHEGIASLWSLLWTELCLPKILIWKP